MVYSLILNLIYVIALLISNIVFLERLKSSHFLQDFIHSVCIFNNPSVSVHELTIGFKHYFTRIFFTTALLVLLYFYLRIRKSDPDFVYFVLRKNMVD
jgi:hypothetical protein